MLGTLQILAMRTDDIHGEILYCLPNLRRKRQGRQDDVQIQGVTGRRWTGYCRAAFEQVDAGKISVEPGPRMANTDWFRIDIHGTSCHGAMPQRGADAAAAATEIVNALQTIVSRGSAP